ncbi:unnamed protein product, partial [Meganyctiphanes norvegica]
MKYLVVIVFLMGFACGSKEDEEVGLQDIQDFDVELDNNDDFAASASPRQIPDLQIIIGNLISGLQNLNTTGGIGAIINQIIGPLTAAGGTTAALAPVVGIKAIVSVIVSTLALGLQGLVELANQIAAIVGLVLLIIFAADGGDVGSLLG